MMIIDLHYLAWRSHFTTGFLDNGILFGVLNQISNLTQKFRDPFVVITGDSKFYLRKKIYPEYKKRGEEPESEDRKITFDQIDLMKTYVLPKLGFQILEEKGYEADDVIASIVQNHKKETTQRLPLVVSGDEDLFQLLNHCRLYFPRNDEIWSSEKFEKQYGISCSRWAEVKAIAGCSSDNVKGVKGVAEKTAIKFLRNELKGESQAWQKIHSFLNSENINLNRKLVYLPFEGCSAFYPSRPNFKMKILAEVFREFDFHRIPIDVWRIFE